MTTHTVTPPHHREDVEQYRHELRRRLEALPEEARPRNPAEYLDGVESLASCHVLDLWVSRKEELVDEVDRTIYADD